MRSQNQKQEDSDGGQHAKELRDTRDIMQRAEARKTFLHSVIKSSTNQFTTLRYCFISEALRRADNVSGVMVGAVSAQPVSGLVPGFV